MRPELAHCLRQVTSELAQRRRQRHQRRRKGRRRRRRQRRQQRRRRRRRRWSRLGPSSLRVRGQGERPCRAVAVLAEPFKIRAWVSTTPGGYEYSAQCDGYSNIARFTSKVVQFNSSRSCSLPASGGVFYANFAVTCQFGTTGCTSTSDMYEYGSLYKFFLSRYIQ